MRKFITNGEDLRSLSGFFFCDNDFLGAISTDEELLSDTIELFNDRLVLDPLTKFEFLRDVHDSKHRLIKENLVEKMFLTAENHPETFTKNFNDALALSRIYAHNKRAGASIVDLMLASRLKNTNNACFIITGNAKDFPNFIFTTCAVINFEQKDGSMRAFSILKFDKNKHLNSIEKYSKIK